MSPPRSGLSYLYKPITMTTTTVKTPLEVRRDDNFLCGLVTEDNPPIMLYMVYIGGPKIEYYLWHGESLIFHGKDYKPSPLFKGFDTLESVACLLGFLVLRPGDTDSEYFKYYTPEQYAFIDLPEIDKIRGLLYDFESGENDAENGIDYKAVATEVLKKWYTC